MTVSNTHSAFAYDDVFRTLVNDCSKLVIPLVNEMFGESYSGEEQIVFTPNEHFLNQQGGSEEKRITDTCFLIVGKETMQTKRYHLECQATLDSSILLRLFEYGAQIALDDASVLSGNRITVDFPHAGVLFLRSTDTTPDKMEIMICTPGGSVSYSVPVIKVKDYSIDEIFKKKLLFLIPFYIFRFESQFRAIDADKTKLEKLRKEYKRIADKLEELAAAGEIDEYYKRTIMEMTERVIANLVKKYENIRKGVEHIMVGQVLDYEAKNIRNEGIAIGITQGIAQGITQGIAQGEILQTIKLYRRLANYDNQQIVDVLMSEFGITEEAARAYISSIPSQ